MAIPLGAGVVLLTRSETGVTYAGRPRMDLPVSIDTLHHSVSTPSGDPVADARVIDRIGKNRGLRAYPYSYGISPDGTVVEGQGDYIGAHTIGHNTDGQGVVLVGNYENRHPTDAQIRSYHALRDWRIRTGRLTPDSYPTWDHQGTGYATACAGRYAREALPRFRSTSEEDDLTPEERYKLEAIYDRIVTGFPQYGVASVTDKINAVHAAVVEGYKKFGVPAIKDSIVEIRKKLGV